LNPSKQEAARVKGLGDIATIISQCTMRESLYHRRYELNSDKLKGFSASHIGYRDALRALYVKILSFQATSVCFLSKNTLTRFGSDLVKRNDWDNLLVEIKNQENTLKSTEEQWRDTKYDQECELHGVRHEQRMRELNAIEEEVTRVRNAIVQTQKDNEREALLRWLSTVDPSSNYNSARREHALSTSQWLVEQSSDFQKWEVDPNSLLWLHGAAGAGKSFLRYGCELRHLSVPYYRLVPN
jgi:flagellar biosynthesis GTPase FlhF